MKKSLFTVSATLLAGYVYSKKNENMLPNTTKAQLLNSITPQGFVKQSFAYGDAPRQQLTVYRSVRSLHTEQIKLPVLFFVHGGSWKSGSKDDYDFLAESFTREGFVVVVINYHLSPEYIYPTFVDDTALALSWTVKNIAQYGGEASSIIAMGHSAGAFNVVAAVNNPKYETQYNLSNKNIAAVIAVAGPYNYDFTTDETAYAFPKEASQEEVMPVNFIKENPVPHLLLMADNDTLVADDNTHDLHAALKKKGGRVEVNTIKNTTHISIIATLATRLTKIATTKAVILAFLASLQIHSS